LRDDVVEEAKVEDGRCTKNNNSIVKTKRMNPQATHILLDYRGTLHSNFWNCCSGCVELRLEV